MVIDDGTGTPSDALLGEVGNAIEAVRAVGSTYSVIRPQLLVVNVSMRITGGVPTLVQTAVTAWIAAQQIGTGIFLSKLTQIVHDSDSSIVNISGLTINGVAADLSMPQFARAVPGIVAIST